jgi:Helix-turn-helix domain
MAIIRGPKPSNNYVVVSNDMARNDQLSWEARGLLLYLLSHAEHWEVNVKQLVQQSPNAGRDRVYRIINELVEAGYIVTQQNRNNQGQMMSMDYIVYDAPAAPASTANGSTANGFSVHGKHGCIRSTIPKEVLSVRSTINTTIISFSEAWKHYPRKIAKGAAEKAFAARLKEGVDPSLLLEATENYARTCKGKESRYILHGSTFYGPDERWKDYLPGGAGLLTSKPMSVLAEFAEEEE